MSLPLLAVLTVFQGQALQLAYPDKPDLREVVVSWNDRNASWNAPLHGPPLYRSVRPTRGWIASR
jgi:hypothetical protein